MRFSYTINRNYTFSVKILSNYVTDISWWFCSNPWIMHIYVKKCLFFYSYVFLCLFQWSGRRHYMYVSGRPSCCVCVDISRTVWWFYMKLGMRVYPGGTILCVDFKVTGSKVKGHRLFCVNLVQCLAYYETWMCNLVWG